ncbi:MAG: hypothetical protein R3F34_05560 [Planctomycetota bacterium]
MSFVRSSTFVLAGLALLGCSPPTVGTWSIDTAASFELNEQAILAEVQNLPKPAQDTAFGGLQGIFPDIEASVTFEEDGTARREIAIPNRVTNQMSRSVVEGTWAEEPGAVRLTGVEEGTGYELEVLFVRKDGALLDAAIIGGASRTLLLRKQ